MKMWTRKDAKRLKEWCISVVEFYERPLSKTFQRNPYMVPDVVCCGIDSDGDVVFSFTDTTRFYVNEEGFVTRGAASFKFHTGHDWCSLDEPDIEKLPKMYTQHDGRSFINNF